jgi:hypothetical protein
LIIEMKKRGLSFPKYEKEGMLFSIKSATSIETQNFQLSSPRSIRRGVKKLVSHENATTSSLTASAPSAA